jgi:hypothetical protein
VIASMTCSGFAGFKQDRVSRSWNLGQQRPHRNVPLPLRPLHRELPFVQIEIAPLERHHLPTPEAGFTAQQHDEVGVQLRLGGFDQLLVLVEVVEPNRRLGIGSSLTVQGTRSITSHSTAFLSSVFNTVNTLLTVFGAGREADSSVAEHPRS